MKIRAFILILCFSLGLVPAARAADRISRLLTSGAWCSVRPAADGRRIRIIYHTDGHYVLTGDHRGNKGHWKVKGGVLYMGEGNNDLLPVASEFRQARRAHLVIFVDGEEFARCR